MSTPFQSIIDIIDTFKSSDSAYVNAAMPISHVRSGVTRLSIILDKDFTFSQEEVVTLVPIEQVETGELGDTPSEIEYTEVKEIVHYINEDLTAKEIFLAGLLSFRSYALQDHSTLTQKAVNFKTINFAVSGLTERAKEAMRIVWWCDNEVERLVAEMRLPYGTSTIMGEVSYE